MDNFDEIDIVELEDEQGNPVKFEFLDYIDRGDDAYVVLLPTEEDATDVIILQVIPEDDDMESYVGIDDDNLVQEIFEIFKERNKDAFDFD